VTSPRVDELVVVAVGGAVGALARAAISTAVPHPDRASWPWATFLTNLLGCLLLGVVLDWVDSRSVGWVGAHPRRARLARPLLASGVLGGFTTFSTFSVESYLLARSGSAGLAVLYAVASAMLGVALVLVGRRAGAAVFGSAAPDLAEDEAL
jgi:CrcB protein